MHPPIRRARSSDQETVVKVLTETFANDPVANWLFPDHRERSRLQSRFYRHQLNHPAAEAYLIGNGEGVSLWHAVPASRAEGEGAPAAPAPNLEDFGESGPRLRALDQALTPRHPGDAHLYLFCIGVISSRQSMGFGSAMLRHGLRRVDAVGLPSYLEASSPRSRDLYLRHGFEILGEPIHLTDGPSLWPMWREPRGSQSVSPLCASVTRKARINDNA